MFVIAAANGNGARLECFALIRYHRFMLDWARWQVKVHRGGRVRCEPGWSLRAQWSQQLPDFDLWYVWSGRGRMQLCDREVELRPGVCFWMRPGRLYLAEQDIHDRLGVSFLHFDMVNSQGRRLSERQELAALPVEVQAFEDVQYVDALMRRLVQLCGSPQRGRVMPAAQSQPIAETLLLALLREYEAAACRPASPVTGGTQRHHRQIILELASRITESPNEVPPIAALARQAGYSPDHFARVFKAVMGQGPQAFIVQARITRARQLLTESTLSVSQIADALGYQDVFFFSRQFKQKTGETPMQYRGRGGM